MGSAVWRPWALELLAATRTKRRWFDDLKQLMVAETLMTGVTVNEVERPHGFKANHLSSWRTLARQGKLVVPECWGGVCRAGGSAGEPLSQCSSGHCCGRSVRLILWKTDGL